MHFQKLLQYLRGIPIDIECFLVRCSGGRIFRDHAHSERGRPARQWQSLSTNSKDDSWQFQRSLNGRDACPPSIRLKAYADIFFAVRLLRSASRYAGQFKDFNLRRVAFAVRPRAKCTRTDRRGGFRRVRSADISGRRQHGGVEGHAI